MVMQKAVIDGVNALTNFQPPGFLSWRNRVKYLLQRFQASPIQHIFREGNTRADSLSKDGLLEQFGHIQLQKYLR